MFGWISGTRRKLDSMEKRKMDSVCGAFNRLEESEELYSSFKRACAAVDSLSGGMGELGESFAKGLPEPPDWHHELDPVEAHDE